MLYIVEVSTKNILFKIDAWQSDCMTSAKKFLRDEQLYCTKEEITMNGDMVLWVEY